MNCCTGRTNTSLISFDIVKNECNGCIHRTYLYICFLIMFDAYVNTHVFMNVFIYKMLVYVELEMQHIYIYIYVCVCVIYLYIYVCVCASIYIYI